jgi:hypothetical protein
MQPFGIVHGLSRFLKEWLILLRLDAIGKQTCNFAKLPKPLVTHRSFCNEANLKEKNDSLFVTRGEFLDISSCSVGSSFLLMQTRL